jgi:hypothetical protein
VLKLDAHHYSPALLEKILLMAGTADSFEAAATALQVVGEISICARTINQLSARLGGQMADSRDARTVAYERRPLPRTASRVGSPPALATVLCDGGRMRTRVAGGGHGIHQPHWRETKNAAFHRMQSTTHSADPQGELPDCFRNQTYVEKLVLGLKKASSPQSELMPADSPKQAPPPTLLPEETSTWQPKTLLRTCVSSLASSDAFGPMMAAEADARGFFAADKRAFVGDGQAYNWSIQERWFATFTPIADFIHVLEYIYEAAKAGRSEPAARWLLYLRWATACWQGKVNQVIEELAAAVVALPADLADPKETSPHKILQRTQTYLANNRTRMDYPRYRREGLPVTSSLAESLVKQISKRVKGTEKFWDDGRRGEAILQIRAAVVSQDDRLPRFIQNRQISPYSPRSHPRARIPVR